MATTESTGATEGAEPSEAGAVMATVGDGWRRSSFCSSHTCVEVMDLPAHVLVSNAASAGDPEGRPVLLFSHVEWDAFLLGVKAGEFDDLTAP